MLIVSVVGVLTSSLATGAILRAARATWQRRREASAPRAESPSPIRLTLLNYAGTGWHTSADAMLALSAAARAREHERIAREETFMT